MSHSIVACDCGDSGYSSRLFILHTGVQALMEGSWQSIICWTCSEFRGEAVGEPDCDGWCWEAFSYWPEKLDHIVSYLEKMPHKSMSMWSINIAPKVTCALLALSLGMSMCRLIHLLECWVHLLKWQHINDRIYRHKREILKADSHTSWSLRHSGVLNSNASIHMLIGNDDVNIWQI